MQTPDALIEAVTMTPGRPVVRVADPITRLKAFILDLAIMVAALMVAALIAHFLDWGIPGLGSPTVDSPLANLAWSLGLFSMINLVPMRATGQTWGKRWQGIAVVDRSENKATLGNQVMRYLLQHIFSLLCLLNVLNLLLVFREDRRCGHDHIMGTRVIEYP